MTLIPRFPPQTELTREAVPVQLRSAGNDTHLGTHEIPYQTCRASIMGIFSRFRSAGAHSKPGGLRRWLVPAGRRDPKLEEIKEAAAADVAEMEEEDRKSFRQDSREDDDL